MDIRLLAITKRTYQSFNILTNYIKTLIVTQDTDIKYVVEEDTNNGFRVLLAQGRYTTADLLQVYNKHILVSFGLVLQLFCKF